MQQRGLNELGVNALVSVACCPEMHERELGVMLVNRVGVPWPRRTLTFSANPLCRGVFDVIGDKQTGTWASRIVC